MRNVRGDSENRKQDSASPDNFYSESGEYSHSDGNASANGRYESSDENDAIQRKTTIQKFIDFLISFSN